MSVWTILYMKRFPNIPALPGSLCRIVSPVQSCRCSDGKKMKQLRIMRNLHLLICLLESAECVSHSNRRAVTVSIPTNGTSTVSKHTLPTSEISLTATSRRLTQVLSLITISSWQAFRASRSLLRAFPRSRVSDVQQALRTRRRGRCSLTSAVF